MSPPRPTDIESILHETRLFPPPEGFTSAGPGAEPVAPHVGSMEEYERLYRRSLEDPDGFWSDVAGELDWFQPWDKTLEWLPPDAKWFLGGKTNICHNCLDRQIAAGLADQTALIWEGEPMDAGPEIRRLTYADLHREVCKFANVLKSLGVNKGDVVTIYMPMVPELAVAVLACARIGAPHSVIFGGFSAQAIVDRVVDADSKIIITADGGWRRGQIVPLKENVDAACAQLDVVDHVVVLERTGADVVWHHEPSDAHGAKRDHWWHDLMQAAPEECPAEPMDSEDMLFVLYTSGTTGKPKGVYHTVGGYMVFTYYTSKVVFDLHPDASQIYWCTADVGWITGHSYIIYGVLPNRVPTLMYEGAPNHPTPDRFWSIVERHKVTHFYTAPTAIRAFMKWGDDFPRKHDLSSLRVLGTVGEPINPEAWMWYHRMIGRQKCPIVDTWWQTETGGHMITPLPGATPAAPGSCALPFFGVDAAVVNEDGEEVPHETGGLLAIRRPWPSMTRGVLGDRKRFVETYWSRIIKSGGTGSGGTGSGGTGSGGTGSGGTGVSPVSGTGGTGVSPVRSDAAGDAPVPYYFAGDGAKRDEHGYFWIMGRVDDVINVSGHRLGAAEVESALVSHESVVEAAVVGAPHDVKGEGVAAFVTLAPGFQAGEDLRTALRGHVAEQIGALAKPDQIRFTDALPKTRSGKIMRRLLRDIAAGKEKVGDTTTLEDYSVLARLRESNEG